jgi:hypothetical protein
MDGEPAGLFGARLWGRRILEMGRNPARSNGETARERQQFAH